MTDPSASRSGHCLCGAIAYRVPYPFMGEIAHCHCSMCRRQSASVAVTWFTVPLPEFEITRGDLKVYKSSDHGERGFCGDCGTPVTFWTSRHPDIVDVSLMSLAEDQIEPATKSIHTEARLPWVTLDPGLPETAGDV